MRARTNRAAGPPTLYVVIGASGSSLVASDPRTRAAMSARRQSGAHDLPPVAPAGEDLLGERGDVPAAHRDAHVTRPDLTGQERHQVLAPRQPHDPGARMGVEHGVDDQPAGDARHRRRARRVDVGEHDDVRADEGIGVVPPHLGDAVVAIGLEGDDHPTPSVAALARGGDVGGDLRREVGIRVDERGPTVDATDVEASGHAAEASAAPSRWRRTGRRGSRPWRWRPWR